MSTDVVHVLEDKLGGVTEIARKLLAYCRRSNGAHEAVLVRRLHDEHPATRVPLPADRVQRVEHELPKENVHAAARRLADALPDGPGLLVAHDWLELAAAHRHDPGRAVLQVLHGDMPYYYDLAQRHQHVVDRFVTYSKACQEHLQGLIPERAPDVLLVPYGIEMDVPIRKPASGPLRLCFSGRLDHGHKGVLDLPKIDLALCTRNVDVAWTIIGTGRDEQVLRDAWENQDVRFLGRKDNTEVRQLLAEQDVFVLPTRGEGFPVALLEAMAAGLVPVVSDIRSGVPEIVHEGQTGYRPSVGDTEGFAEAIACLARDRSRLNTMSTQARSQVENRYEVSRCSQAWDELFDTCRAMPRRPWSRRRLPYGSRLDRPWIPNRLVRLARRGDR